MSANNQSNGKKSCSGNSSAINTPSSTPVTSSSGISNGQATIQSTPPLNNNNAPKYGTLVPNRVFVGGISANTTEGELLQLFSNYGTVKAAKIIQDRAGVSKGYGFITFESEDDAKRLQREADNIVLRERKLNIAPAIKKQPFSRAFDASSPPSVATGNPAQYFFQPGAMPYFQSGVAYYTQPTTAPGDPNTQQTTVYQSPPVYPAQSGPPQTATYPSVMFPAQPIYMPQQYPMPLPYEYNYYPNNGGPQYMVGSQTGPQPQGPPMQPPGSPPRPPCYNQQLPYNPDAMFYNLPLYNPVDGPAMYSDSLDIANGGYTEESYAMMDSVMQEIEPSAPLFENESVVESITLSSPTSSTPQIDTTRQSNTPVVSLLSLDQHQEKDFTSMQSGRRRKSLPPPSLPPPASTKNLPTPSQQQQQPPIYNHHHQNMYPFHNCTNMFRYPTNTIPNASLSFLPPGNDVGYMPKYSNNNNNNRGAFGMNGEKFNWAASRKRRDRVNHDTTSIRSDSNSSASVVDENRNEDNKIQQVMTTSSSPPPAPYSPITNYSANKYYNSRSIGGGRNARGHYQNIGNRSRIGSSNNNNNNNNVNRRFSNGSQTFTSVNYKSNYRNSTEGAASGDFTNKPPNNFVPNQQMHAASSQHFVPPSRRNRKSIRRNTHAGAPLSEIGAGDAPLPNPDVTDTCKKLDSLKL